MEGSLGSVRRRKVARGSGPEGRQAGSHVPRLGLVSWPNGIGIGIGIAIAVDGRKATVPKFFVLGADSERDWNPDSDTDSDPEIGSTAVFMHAAEPAQGLILVPRTSRNILSQFGCAGHAGAVTRFPST